MLFQAGINDFSDAGLWMKPLISIQKDSSKSFNYNRFGLASRESSADVQQIHAETERVPVSKRCRGILNRLGENFVLQAADADVKGDASHVKLQFPRLSQKEFAALAGRAAKLFSEADFDRRLRFEAKAKQQSMLCMGILKVFSNSNPTALNLLGFRKMFFDFVKLFLVIERHQVNVTLLGEIYVADGLYRLSENNSLGENSHRKHLLM